MLAPADKARWEAERQEALDKERKQQEAESEAAAAKVGAELRTLDAICCIAQHSGLHYRCLGFWRCPLFDKDMCCICAGDMHALRLYSLITTCQAGSSRLYGCIG